jgi:LuxR family transcriptional regulator, quorum-sensing system regulator SolR
MGDFAISKDELQAVLQIINDLTVGSDCRRQLDEAVAKIGALVPFEKCVLLHERKTEPGTAALIYDTSADSAAGTRRQLTGGGPPDLNGSLKSLHRIHTFQNAFFWHGVAASESASDRKLATFFNQNGVSQGIAGSIDSFGGNSDSVTLIHLQCAEEQFAAKQLLFVNSIVFHLHSYFRRCSASLLCSSSRQTLTSKEREVLQWVMEGKTSWEVGRILAVSERTVKFHLRNIYSKLDVVNRAQAVTMASRLRLV